MGTPRVSNSMFLEAFGRRTVSYDRRRPRPCPRPARAPAPLAAAPAATSPLTASALAPAAVATGSTTVSRTPPGVAFPAERERRAPHEYHPEAGAERGSQTV